MLWTSWFRTDSVCSGRIDGSARSYQADIQSGHTLHSTGASTAEGTEECLVLQEQLQRDQGGRPTAAPGLQRVLALLVWLIKRPWGMYTSSLRKARRPKASLNTVVLLTSLTRTVPLPWCIGGGSSTSAISVLGGHLPM
ncbi:unnamed protein product [Ectocarpus sp. 4 AP-2014]